MTRYFEGLKEEHAIKNRYKELAKKHHPDLGGCVETMKEINAQYEAVMEGYYQAAGKSITEIEELLKKDIGLVQALLRIVHLVGLNVEICGYWLWITGMTKAHKDVLKREKFYWSANKQAWYWRPPEHKSFNRSRWSLDKIRAEYGSRSLDASKLERVKVK